MILPQLRAAVIFVGLFSVVTGIIYPLFVTGLGQLLFPFQANGSILTHQGRNVGSSLIGQQFTSTKYFWGRPSATQPTPYNALSSAGSNLSPTNPELIFAVKDRLDALLKANPEGAMPVPLELVTASASGLDPHISVKGALFQAPRVAKQRKINITTLQTLINQHTKSDNVNVLALNLALDELSLQGITAQ
jgi:K+-transporting ATPase ATPase C chain